MNDWQHQQQMDEQERLEEIERLLDEAETDMDYVDFDLRLSSRAKEWRKEIEVALGLPKLGKEEKL